MAEPLYKNEAWLRAQYLEERRSTINIAEEVSVSKTTVIQWLRKFNIPRRTTADALRINLDSTWLQEQYSTNGLSLEEVAKLANCSVTVVYKSMKMYGIPRRSKSEIKHKHYQDPIYRDRMVAKLREYGTDPEIRARRAKTLHETLSDPLIHAKRAEFLRQLHEDPLIKAKIRLAMIKYNKTHPEQIKHRMEKCHAPEANRKRGESTRGNKHYNWRGGISYEPYTAEFNEARREFVRERDGRQCNLCGMRENGLKLDVHHINYNKKDTRVSNLISLCHRCHTKTSHDRYFWFNLFVNQWVINTEINLNYNF